jgi:TolB-like protein/tetratricopeptide (TPR) repeat protein
MSVDAAGRTNPPSSESRLAGVTAAEVAAALDLILASDVFSKVERPRRFLRHLVEASLRGQQNLLKESLLGIEIFGREPSWNPRIDPIVRQEAARLRKRLARYYETASPEVRIHLAVGTYVPVFDRAAGETAELKIADPGTSLEDVPEVGHKPKRYLWIALAVVLLLTGGAAGTWRYLRASSTGSRPSIVVLPFTDLSTDQANEYLASAVTGEITDELGRLNSLKVIARSSAQAFKSGGPDVRNVGRQLDVSYVLQGSVERSADAIRISAHLERASDGFRVWYQTYDRQAKDLSAIQLELAESVARALQVSSGRAATPRHVPTEEVHELYMRASFEINEATPESIARAEQDLRRAVQMDPEYGSAWGNLGVAKFNLAGAIGRNRTPAELQEAKSFYRKALDLDPELTVTRTNLAMIALTYDWDWKGAEREFILASRDQPNAAAEVDLGILLAFRGRFGEADRQLELARSLDPLGSTISNNLMQVRYWESRFPEAIGLAQQMLERYPGQLAPQLMMSLSYSYGGQPEVALANLRHLEARHPGLRLNEVIALGRCGRREEGLKLLRQLETEYGGEPVVSRQGFAIAWASMGDYVQALKWLEMAADLHEYQILNLAVNPAFADMRNDPRFRALEKRIGLL